MAALTSGKAVKSIQGGRKSCPQKGSTTVYQGGIVMMDASGYAKPGATATGCIAVGVALDNNGLSYWTNSGADGASEVEYMEGCFGFVNSGSSIADSDRGKDCYIVDDQTVHLTDGSGTRSPAGRIEKVGEDGLVYVDVRVGVTRQLTEAQIISTAQVYTQTYSTADRTIAALTSVAPAAITATSIAAPNASAMATVTTVGANTGTSGAGLSLIGDTTAVNQAANLMNDLVALQEDILDAKTKYDVAVTLANELKVDYTALLADFTDLRTQVVALQADVLAMKKNDNAIIDDLQTADIVD